MRFRLCLVAVKRFPENTYFPEMLISRKGKYFHVFGCISKNFPENIFWCLEKNKENTNPEKHKPQPRKKSSTTTNPVRRPRRRSRSIPVFGSFKYFYKKCIKSSKRNQNPAKENESTTSNERCDRGATSGAMSDE